MPGIVLICKSFSKAIGGMIARVFTTSAQHNGLLFELENVRV